MSSLGHNKGYSFVSRGPWFREIWVEDDGLDWFYTFLDNDNKKNYLLSNNIPLKDREIMNHLFFTQRRNNYISWALGLYLGMEAVTKSRYSMSCAKGWQFVQWLGFSFFFKECLMGWSGSHYNPTIGAIIRKHHQHVKQNMFEIKDEKKSYFYIDDSQYMNVTNAELSDEFHGDHGPTPVSYFNFEF